MTSTRRFEIISAELNPAVKMINIIVLSVSIMYYLLVVSKKKKTAQIIASSDSLTFFYQNVRLGINTGMAVFAPNVALCRLRCHCFI